MYDIEKYYQAESVEEAVRLLNEHPEAKVISGGSDVLIKIREGMVRKSSMWAQSVWRKWHRRLM